MKYWNTGDVVVDSILQKLEGFGTWRSDSDAESTPQLLSGVIQIQEMLPGLVARHFQFPNLFVGNGHFSGSQDYRRDLIHRITSAISEGLERVTCIPKTPPDLRRVRPTKGWTDEGTIYGRTNHSDDQGTGSW